MTSSNRNFEKFIRTLKRSVAFAGVELMRP